MNMIEKVARAIAKKCDICHQDENQYFRHMDDAKAAIEAMKKPMIEVMFEENVELVKRVKFINKINDILHK